MRSGRAGDGGATQLINSFTGFVAAHAIPRSSVGWMVIGEVRVLVFPAGIPNRDYAAFIDAHFKEPMTDR